MKSWVIGISQQGHSKAYDWNELVKNKMISDSLTGLPLLITLENDTASFYVSSRIVKGNVLTFQQINGVLKDDQTSSRWSMDGLCINGALKGEQLKPVEAYQEFWHSWKTFHPRTSQYPQP